jgi:hypothetical protein
MPQYQNYSGTSGVYAYEIGFNSITVQFKDGAIYLYNTNSTSAYNIAHMHRLAVAGRGLNSFISTTVKKGYVSKLR